jgi:hypothetical protein
LSSAHAAEVTGRYIRRFFPASPPVLSDTKPEDSIKSPSRIKPQWLATVQERMYSSIVPKDKELENDGRWLRYGVAEIASAFFQMTSDLLPSEPHIYGSQIGDLVAEFEDTHGTMTSIITPTSVILFAVVDGVPIEKRLVPGSDSPTALRRELRELTESLRTGQHDVETTK